MDETEYKSPSSLLHEWVQEIIDEEPPTSILNGVENHDSAHQTIEDDKGIYVSNAEWQFAPKLGTEAGVFDVLLILSFYYRVEGADKTERAAARDRVGAMAQIVASRMFGDQTLGNRFCDFLLLRAVDGSKSIKSDFYAIINLPVILNPSGERIDYQLGEAK